VKFKPLENLDEQVTEYLSNRIIRGQLSPGERILETKLARELGVSRGPIRAALRILENKRLVKLVPRRGAKVSELSVSFIDRLYDILIELLALATRKAARNRTKKDLTPIRRSLSKIEACAQKGDTNAYYNAIFEFFVVEIEAAKDPLLARLLIDLEPSARRIQFASLSRRKENLKRNVVYFQDAAKYIEAGDPVLADKVIRAYAQNEKEFALNNTRTHIKK